MYELQNVNFPLEQSQLMKLGGNRSTFMADLK